MTLTKENMLTVKEGIKCDVRRLVVDICHMDESQLEKYLSLAFKGEKDISFLPPEFWHGYSLKSSERELGVGEYFGGQVYHLVIEACQECQQNSYSFNFFNEGGERFLKILKKMMLQTLNSEVTLENKLVATSFVEVARSIKSNENRKSLTYPEDHREIHALGLRLNSKFKCCDYYPNQY